MIGHLDDVQVVLDDEHRVARVRQTIENIDQARDVRHVQTLMDVGLGYVKLGQPSTTLSGGEAQRIKLATELSKRSTGRTIYVLDEPIAGVDPAARDYILNTILANYSEDASCLLYTSDAADE